MQEDERKKREFENRRQFSFRLNLFFFATFMLFSVLIVKLAIIQFVEGDSLKEEETRSSSKDVKSSPIRGNIYDSSGKAIAYSTSTQSLYYTIQPGAKREDSIAMAQRLLAIFNKYGDEDARLTLDQIKKNMDLSYSKFTSSVPRRIKSGLSNKEIAYFLENRDRFTGIDIVEESIRHYDPSSIAVQLVGYLKKYSGGADQTVYKNKPKPDDPLLQYLPQEDVGVDGLEYMYQDVLRGKNGVKTYPINSSGRIIGPPDVTYPEKGADLYLTINRHVQLKTEQAIMDHLQHLQTTSGDDQAKQARTGYAVAMEVKTGKVIAMASMPDYDPNIWEGGSISSEDYEKIELILQNGTISPVNPYRDPKEQRRHPSSIVFLGSTQKPLSVLVGLNEGLFTTTTKWTDNGFFVYGKDNSKIKNAQNHVYGSLDPAQAITKSSNPWMAKMIGDALNRRDGARGVDLWDRYMKQFGLGADTGSGLPYENRGIIEYFHERDAASSQSALIRASFGQMGRYTTLQLAQYASMLANQGKRMKPQFVNVIKDAEGKVLKSFQPVVLNTVQIPKAYWDEVYRGMAQVRVAAFNDAPYQVLRKTGTSEQQTSVGLVDNAVFISFAPAENPVLAVAVVVPEGGFGANGAGPIARKIFDAYDEAVGLNGVPKMKNVQTLPETETESDA